MNDLQEKHKAILALIISDYIETAQPVASERLVDFYKLHVSSATIRNWMVDLTEMGYLRKSHRSAGRVPTEEGYRYFVRQSMGQIDLPDPTKRTISHQFYQAGLDVDRLMRLAASVLAHQSQAASLVTAPHLERPHYKHLELINTQGHQVLMVLVLAGGDIHQQILALSEPVTQVKLSSAAAHLNALFQNLDADGILAHPGPLDTLEQDVAKLVAEDMQRSSAMVSGEVYRDGLSNVLNEPEFGETEVARKALRILEERPLLEDLLSRTVMNSDLGGVHVLIGGEGNWEELKDFTMILSRYGVPGLATGTVGVLGPIRMSYGRTISTVRFVSNLLSDLVNELHPE